MLFCVLAKSKEPFVWMGKIEFEKSVMGGKKIQKG
jgi:hypothetical protein